MKSDTMMEDSLACGIVRRRSKVKAGITCRNSGASRSIMNQQASPGVSPPEREQRPARSVFIPIGFAIVLVAVVIALVFAIVQPWEADEDGPPPLPPTATAAP
jgi:hypothetical protein